MAEITVSPQQAAVVPVSNGEPRATPPISGSLLVNLSWQGGAVLRPGRVRVNFIRGRISAAISATATTISSPYFAVLPAVDYAVNKDYIPLTLDPFGDILSAATAPEIVWVTAHTAGSTTVTVLRAQEGTTARAHAADTRVFQAPTKLDALE